MSRLILIGDLLLSYQAYFAIQTEFEESANLPSPKHPQHMHPGK